MKVSRLTSRYPDRDVRPSPSIRPTARGRMGGRIIPHPSPSPANSAVATPTIDPIGMLVHGSLCEPRRPMPTPIAIPQPAPIRTAVWTPVMA